MTEASMGDQQPPGEADKVDQKPPGEAAMVDKQKPGEAAARYPVADVAEAVAFLSEIKARLEEDPGVRDELLDLLVGFGEGRGDAHAVKSQTAGLLREHPDVLDRFSAFLSRAKPPVVPAEGLAATRPRRSSTCRTERGSRCRSVPAEEGPDVAGGGHTQGHRQPRKSAAAGAGGCSASTGDDPRIKEALAFQDRVLETLGFEGLAKVRAVLLAEDMYADVVYARARDAFGPAHGDLLQEFATMFLPGQKEWKAHEARRLARQRRADAADRKMLLADDGDHRRGAVCVGESSGAGAAARSEVDRDVTCKAVKKKRHADDGDHRGHALRVGESSGGARVHRHGHDDDYAPRCRTKKPRADDDGHRRHGVSHGEPPGSGAAARVLDAGVHGHGDKKKPRRRAPNGGEGSSAAAALPPPGPEPSPGDDALVRQFRVMRVFNTLYSTLVDTMARAEALLHGAAGGIPTSVEELFPRRESREFLSEYYGDDWGVMRVLLEGVESTRPALEAVLESLKRKEEEAVAEEVRERRRQDTERAAERLSGLVTGRVHHEEHRRQDAADGGASGQSTRAPGGDSNRSMDPTRHDAQGNVRT
ncbi:hypothetical protein C2845_PM06G30780 [Panicum miliaceum]|uniref:Uncharacterized protein n=1 Tax=Panicum miliaceum TaxID=4540 RepID=A0A3L6R7X1_PANMI|nr:hypothetical protein C2845_PM06G30780 [Panicum miliaceum]